MNGPAIQRNPAKQSTGTTFVFRVILQQPAAFQARQHIVQPKPVGNHFLMRMGL